MTLLWLTLDVFVIYVEHLQELIVDNFGILAIFQALIADIFGICSTLRKNKHSSKCAVVVVCILIIFGQNQHAFSAK